jgi:hypothetical protein
MNQGARIFIWNGKKKTGDRRQERGDRTQKTRYRREDTEAAERAVDL